ncbi:MAG: Ryanodine receptor Ryr [Lawsonibacter sp.]|nr:Ryanodine receptor Ryr [Lawsonibacter sp.]
MSTVGPAQHGKPENAKTRRLFKIKNQEPKIVVTGDICINTLMWSVLPQGHEGLTWENNTNLHSISKPGESLLLAEMTALATGKQIISPSITKNIGPYTDRFLHSFVEIEPFPSSTDRKKAKVYRVGRFMGLAGTASGNPELLPIEDDASDARIVIIDDENNGFNNDDSYWPSAIKSTWETPMVLYKMNNPTGGSALWQQLSQYQNDNTITIINADNLRSKGVNISKSLSWEKTALDFVWQLSNNPSLSFLSTCRHLIVLFGLEGVIYYKNDSNPEARLYFLPYEFEGDFEQKDLGKMYGLTSAFVAGLSAAFLGEETDELSTSISQGIREGMNAIRKCFHYGFGENPDSFLFPNPLIFERNSADTTILNHIQDVKIPNIFNKDYQDGWCILQGKSSASIAQMAFDLVKNGEGNVLMRIPTARFGKLKTVDRIEIESYRTIHNLISEYISSKNTVRPLSIAIFGTPGSGKSYGLTEMATSTFPEDIQKLNYNISQFSTPLELQTAFHKISDYNLMGKIPLVVFDEFDTSFEGNLGWLKYFLSPMQDGVYKSEETFHPIGKAIFVFVGGTSSSFSEFCGEKIEDEDEKRIFLNEFKANKGPDFVSRLRGYINILGPNQSDDNDQFFMLRRAKLIRSLIEQKLPHLIDEKGEAQIDDGVLRAMLKIPRYKHESRSVEAIMDMSTLAQAKKWEQSSLPPKEQLKLHLDEKLFLRYMMHDAIFSEKVEAIARLLRDRFNGLETRIAITNDDASMEWDNLSEATKDFYRDHVKNIPEALLLVQYDVLYVDDKAENASLSEDELGELVRLEYKRRRNYDKINDTSSTQTRVLSKNEMKTQIYQMVSLWAASLAESNFRLEKIKYANEYNL